MANGHAALGEALEENEQLRARVAALEEFVAAADKLSSYEQSYPEGLNPLVVLEELDRLQGQFVAIRNRLAAEHGLPLPEVER